MAGHGHDHREPLTDEEFRELFEQPSWEERYGAKDDLWSGNPNPQLVAEASGLAPGRALDVGCGEGGDAIWLAQQKWQVAALDFSVLGLARAAAHAENEAVAHRIEWLHADVRKDDLGSDYDLVTSQFLHQPDGGMVEVTRRLAETVAPGGTLLVVGHHPEDAETGLRWRMNDAMFTPDDLVPALDPEAWTVLAEVRERSVEGPDRQPVTVRDSVIRATRR
ncbi:class I SAM-dependent methyltransferase [Nocardioides sp. JQ2195]|uniref:SAM-dependent methyltransferase n=1 Tax=Nocardioides sp. JQ2195 TaxID=2592334 RepID=UPI00143E798B|nr:class I SAM-dependent methyltransferase [Nocardioides sp. JQ2195]QIX27499.1 class I SAM-dependent methyltransferase [Nocardioides sp. JQ2195]